MELGSRIQSEVQSEMDKTQREYLLREQMNAIRRELGEEDESQAEINELRERMEEAGLPEEARKQAERELSRLEKLPPAAAEHGVIRTYLEWILDLPWRQVHRGQPRHRARAQGARRRSLRHREGEGPDPRPSRRAQAEARRTRFDPVVRRTRPAWARPRSASRSPRRWAASSSASRSAACATRPRSAGTGAPTSARMPGTIIRALRDAELEQPGVHDRRDRQDGRGLPRRPRERDARGARPRAELVVPRPLPRPAVRPVARHVHHDGEHPRHDPGAAARPHGGDPALRLHGRGEARDRQALPDPAPDRAQRAHARADRDQGRGDRHRDPRLHARGRRAQPRARAGHALPQGRARVRRGQGQAAG